MSERIRPELSVPAPRRNNEGTRSLGGYRSHSGISHGTSSFGGAQSPIPNLYYNICSSIIILIKNYLKKYSKLNI